MSRGLSDQQRRILGIAVCTNILTQQGRFHLKTGESLLGYRVPTIDYSGIADLRWQLPAHLIHGLSFTDQDTRITKSNGVQQPAGEIFDLMSPGARSAKASVIRAISGLIRTGYLSYVPNLWTALPWGYVLTEKGYDVGIGYSVREDYAPWVILRTGIVAHIWGEWHGFAKIEALLENGILSVDDVIALTVKDALANPYTHISETLLDWPIRKFGARLIATIKQLTASPLASVQ